MKARVSLLLLVLFCFICPQVFAQKDSVKITVSEESIDTSNFKIRQEYKYIDINMLDETNLIKIGIFPFGLLDTKKFWYSLDLSYEVKIKSNFSLVLFSWNRIYKKWFEGYLSSDLRFYYSMNKRIKKGICGNNLNGNYLATKVVLINYISNNKLLYQNHKNNISLYPGILAGWGLQQRIGKLGYFNGEFLAGKNFKGNMYPFDLYLNLEIGFGFNLKRKK